jgi:hypothetical protein
MLLNSFESPAEKRPNPLEKPLAETIMGYYFGNDISFLELF